jgi:hypothetical protein
MPCQYKVVPRIANCGFSMDFYLWDVIFNCSAAAIVKTNFPEFLRLTYGVINLVTLRYHQRHMA